MGLRFASPIRTCRCKNEFSHHSPKEKKMHKSVAFILVMLFAFVGMGCIGDNKPSNKDVEKALARAYDVRFTLASKPYNLKYDFEIIDFKRDNGQELPNNHYEVTGKAILKPRSSKTMLSDTKPADMSKTYEKEEKITFIKTEKGWKPIRLDDDILGVFHPMVDVMIDRKLGKQ
jgi:hypothetical protein